MDVGQNKECGSISHGGASVTDDLENDLPAARTVVEIDKEDLLPCAKPELAVCHRNTERRSEKRGAYVRKAIAVPPSRVMLVVDVPGRHPFDCLSQIVQCAFLILDSGNSGGCSRYKSAEETALNGRGREEFSCKGSDVVHIAESPRLDADYPGT